MELGEKLRQARQEQGMSQRQLCGDRVTRNMLSQIENGSARPSMQTLQYFAERLGKPVSFFLNETMTVSANQSCMEHAWNSYERQQYSDAEMALRDYRSPDAMYDREYSLLSCLVLMGLAEQAIFEGREIRARELLARAEEREENLRWLPELSSRRARLLGKLPGVVPEALLPNLDEDLFLLARGALSAGNPVRAAALLDAAQDQSSGLWNLLRGKAALHQKSYAAAARYLQAAEADYPEQTIPDLERCFRELGDYKLAYHYACKGRR